MYRKSHLIFRDDDSDSDSDIEMSVISKGRHDIVIKQEGKISGGFFKVTKKMHPMYPFHEEKIKCDEYGEIIKPEDYKLADINPDEDNKENILIKKEEEEISMFSILLKSKSLIYFRPCPHVHSNELVQFCKYL